MESFTNTSLNAISHVRSWHRDFYERGLKSRTVTVTVVFLIVTVCFIKHRTTPDVKVKMSMVKFGFFLLLGNGINLVEQIATC